MCNRAKNKLDQNSKHRYLQFMTFQSCVFFSQLCSFLITLCSAWSSLLPRYGARHLKMPSYLGRLHNTAFFSVGKRPPERPPEAQEGRQSGSPLMVFLYFSSRLSKPKKQKGFIKARCLSLSWNLRGLWECIVPLFSFPLNASRRKHKDKMLYQLLPGCLSFW